MKLHCFIFLLISSYYLYSQAPDIEWQNTIGGGSDDKLYSIKQTKDGGYILGGASGSNIYGDKTEANYGLKDYWVLKLDSASNITWQKTIGGGQYDYLYSIETNDGGYICAGSSESEISGNKTISGLGAYDYWVVKLDSLGEIDWQKIYGGDLDDNLYVIQQTTDNGYILGGWSKSGISGNKEEPSMGDQDYWIIKIDSIGEIEWQNTVGGDKSDILYDLDQTIDGGYILGGWSGSSISGDKTEGSILRTDGLPSDDYWIVKIDNIGELEWQNTIGGNDHDYLDNIQQTKDKGFILSGRSSSGISADKTENNIGLQDFWIIKIDTIGNIIWQNTIGGADDEGNGGVCIQETYTGGYIISGSSDSDISGDKTENSEGYADYWVIKLNSIGSIQWQSSIGGSTSDYSTQISQTYDGGYIVGGHSGSDISGDKTEDDIGNGDYWIVKLYADEECTPLAFYADYDGDGFGNNYFSILSCDTPAAYVLDNTDCNDFDAAINPAILEICNSVDDNCNSIVDEDVPYFTYFEDADNDGYGNIFSFIINCIDTIPTGYVTDSTDCDDANNTIHEPLIYYADADGDLYGNAFIINEFCNSIPPDGYVTNNLDCNDADNSINPTSNEICNTLDDNCNEVIDEDLPVQVLYEDADGDTYGNAESDTTTCLFEISGYVADSTDCDDDNPNIYPGAEEIFNGTDDDCDKEIDEGVSIQETIINNIFMVHPNPNNGNFTIEWQKESFAGQVEIRILNSTGQLIYKQILTTEKTEIHLPEHLHGIFQINVTLQQILVYSDHITIIK